MPISTLFPYTTLFRSDAPEPAARDPGPLERPPPGRDARDRDRPTPAPRRCDRERRPDGHVSPERDRKSTRLNSSQGSISYYVFIMKKKIKITISFHTL